MVPRSGEPNEMSRSDAMRGDWIHTVYRSATGNWANQLGAGRRVLGVYATKDEAVRRGEELAREADTNHVIHTTDGTIASSRWHAHDPGKREAASAP
jgi:hypothetical protein